MNRHTIPLPHGIMNVLELPKEAYHIRYSPERRELTYKTSIGNKHMAITDSGQWQLLGITPLIEEQADISVESFTMLLEYDIKERGYNNYLGGEGFTTALESFHSLLTANGVDVSKRWAVLFDKK